MNFAEPSNNSGFLHFADRCKPPLRTPRRTARAWGAFPAAIIKWAAFVLWLSAIPLALRAEIFSWADPNGVRHFSNAPLPETLPAGAEYLPEIATTEAVATGAAAAAVREVADHTQALGELERDRAAAVRKTRSGDQRPRIDALESGRQRLERQIADAARGLKSKEETLRRTRSESFANIAQHDLKVKRAAERLADARSRLEGLQAEVAEIDRRLQQERNSASQ